MDIKSAVCMPKYIKDNKNTNHISRRVNFVRNGKKWKMHNIGWCEGGIQYADIVTNLVLENDLNAKIKYIMVRFDNWYRIPVQEGWHDIG